MFEFRDEMKACGNTKALFAMQESLLKTLFENQKGEKRKIEKRGERADRQPIR